MTDLMRANRDGSHSHDGQFNAVRLPFFQLDRSAVIRIPRMPPLRQAALNSVRFVAFFSKTDKSGGAIGIVGQIGCET
jgi:hypothetical protein